MHKLLRRQLRQAQQADRGGALDLDALLQLVDSAYLEIDRERRVTAHAHDVLRKEYAELTERQLLIHSAMARVEAEKAEAERARAAAEAELLRQENLSLLGRLTSSLAHELRNPLSTLRNTAYAIHDVATQSGLVIDRQIERLQRTIDRCDGIIADLLAFASAREVNPTPMMLDPWLGEVLREEKMPAGITLDSRFAAPGAMVGIDRERLRCALGNLIQNAVEALIEVPELTERRITVATRLGDEAEIVIRDTGPGIPGHLLARVFEPLFSTRAFGTGLGLPTAQQIVLHHGGTMTIGNPKGGGTEIVIRLPLLSARSAAA